MLGGDLQSGDHAKIKHSTDPTLLQTDLLWQAIVCTLCIRNLKWNHLHLVVNDTELYSTADEALYIDQHADSIR